VENASLRAKDLTYQLITFSKGGAPVKKTTSLLNVIKESAVFVLRGSPVRCECIFPEGLWPVEIDEGQISQVIHNLTLNAKQAMSEGGVIEIYAENFTLGPESSLPIEEGKYLKIQITDRGCGISKENLQKIFDPYFTTKQEGSGLGLAASYSIVRNHGGYITVDSVPGAETTFTIYLPASEKNVSSDKAVQQRAVTGVGRVLIMDDEEMVRQVAGEMLKTLGYTVEFARHGAEAIEMHQNARESGQPIDVVIMDLTIPGGMGGEEATKRLLETNPEAKVLVSSGYSDNPLMADYRKFGFSGVLIKPYNITQLSEEMRKAITANP
jgi:CheY-like chemotaxis protein